VSVRVSSNIWPAPSNDGRGGATRCLRSAARPGLSLSSLANSDRRMTSGLAESGSQITRGQGGRRPDGGRATGCWASSCGPRGAVGPGAMMDALPVIYDARLALPVYLRTHKVQ